MNKDDRFSVLSFFLAGASLVAACSAFTSVALLIGGAVMSTFALVVRVLAIISLLLYVADIIACSSAFSSKVKVIVVHSALFCLFAITLLALPLFFKAGA